MRRPLELEGRPDLPLITWLQNRNQVTLHARGLSDNEIRPSALQAQALKESHTISILKPPSPGIIARSSSIFAVESRVTAPIWYSAPRSHHLGIYTLPSHLGWAAVPFPSFVFPYHTLPCPSCLYKGRLGLACLRRYPHYGLQRAHLRSGEIQ